MFKKKKQHRLLVRLVDELDVVPFLAHIPRGLSVSEYCRDGFELIREAANLSAVKFTNEAEVTIAILNYIMDNYLPREYAAKIAVIPIPHLAKEFERYLRTMEYTETVLFNRILWRVKCDVVDCLWELYVSHGKGTIEWLYQRTVSYLSTAIKLELEIDREFLSLIYSVLWYYGLTKNSDKNRVGANDDVFGKNH